CGAGAGCDAACAPSWGANLSTTSTIVATSLVPGSGVRGSAAPRAPRTGIGPSGAACRSGGCWVRWGEAAAWAVDSSSHRTSDSNTGPFCREGGRRWRSGRPRSGRQRPRAPVCSRRSRRAPPLPSSRRRKRGAAHRAAVAEERPQVTRAAAVVLAEGGARLEWVLRPRLVGCRTIAPRP
ncbi:unnamed protein product, partial [Ectocarpus fasciculatus]